MGGLFKSEERKWRVENCCMCNRTKQASSCPLATYRWRVHPFDESPANRWALVEQLGVPLGEGYLSILCGKISGCICGGGVGNCNKDNLRAGGPPHGNCVLLLQSLLCHGALPSCRFVTAEDCEEDSCWGIKLDSTSAWDKTIKKKKNTPPVGHSSCWRSCRLNS